MFSLNEQSATMIREMNHECTQDTRQTCAQLSAIWYQVEHRALWKEWGYGSLPDCIVAESERSYPTIMEGVVNYKFFVVEQGVAWEEFLSLMVQLGIKKMTAIRRQEEMLNTPPEDPDIAVDPPLSPEQRRERIRLVSKKVDTMSVKETQLAVREVAASRGIQTTPTTSLHYNNIDVTTANLIKQALAHIKKRAAYGSPFPTITDTEALGLLAGEYLQNYGMRAMKKSA